MLSQVGFSINRLLRPNNASQGRIGTRKASRAKLLSSTPSRNPFARLSIVRPLFPSLTCTFSLHCQPNMSLEGLQSHFLVFQLFLTPFLLSSHLSGPFSATSTLSSPPSLKSSVQRTRNSNVGGRQALQKVSSLKRRPNLALPHLIMVFNLHL